jgi:branched-chain amino acid transport system substrate-binding protein
MIPGMFDRLRIRWAPIVLLSLVTGCAQTITPEPRTSSSLGSAEASETVGFAAGVCASDAFGCVEVDQGDPIIIGTALTLTGPDAARGLDSQYGAQVALNLRGPVLRHEVELVNHDDRCSADGGTAAASLLIELGSMVAVIGTSCSSAAKPATDILGERGILLVSPSNTAPYLTADDANSPYYARTAPNDVGQARAMAEWACAEAGVATAATIGDGSGYADAMQEAFATEFASQCDGTITKQVVASPEPGRVDAALDSIANSNRGASPELLYYPLAGDLGLLVTSRARKATGLEDTILAGIHTGEDGAASSDPSDGMYLSTPMVVPTGDFYEGAFLDEYRDVSAHDEPIGAFHGRAYDAVNIVLDAVVDTAIEEKGVLYIPRTALRETILAVQGYEGLSGRYSCDAVGDCSESTATVSFVDGRALEPVWP